ncbi:hypothetical protein BDV95DRAFT_633454 [Massariosphaeria phaeospora]|uniref:Nephrocystin 3-like N-terminal domain-containing protein n=1 Tax=Massariosphaeria phaeospora TaxID=100035 RepID=A0A7C8MYD0_9PLEO|nr:hypothetical protein BDV95DRAFT_633454 [Massariosphaeria phaeospora]
MDHASAFSRDNRGSQVGYNAGNIHNHYPDPGNPAEDTCAELLYLTDPEVDREDIRIEKGDRTAGTCEWILEDSDYIAWLASDSGSLWLSGSPGKGKTVLSVFVTEKLEETHDQNTCVVLYFFCRYNDEKQNTAVAVLRGLLFQLLRKRPFLGKYASPPLRKSQAQHTLSSLGILWKIFADMINDPGIDHVICVIDGLDECDFDSRKQLSKLFFSDKKSAWTNKFKLFGLSRPLQVLYFEPKRHIRMDTEKIMESRADVKKFIEFSIQNLSLIRDFGQIETEVRIQLLRKAKETFLWVGLLMQELEKKSTCLDILDALEESPTGLTALYFRFLSQIDGRRGGSCSRILRWISEIHRPLTLAELADALGYTSSRGLSATAILHSHLDACGSLIQIKPAKRENIFFRTPMLHVSLKDYLRNIESNNPSVDQFRIDERPSHLEISQRCLAYLSTSMLKTNWTCFNLDHIKSQSPFLFYAAIFWITHALKTPGAGLELYDPLSPFLSADSPLRLNWFLSYFLEVDKIAFIRHYGARRTEGPIIHKAIQHGLRETFNYLTRSDADFQYQNDLGITALHLAIESGDQAITDVILSRGGAFDRSAATWNSTLCNAAFAGRIWGVKFLFENGIDVNKMSVEGWFPLTVAVMGNHLQTIRFLLNKTTDISQADKYGRTALMAAAITGNETVIKMLIQQGSLIDMVDILKNTALHYAALERHEKGMEILHRHHADTSLKNLFKKTATDHQSTLDDVDHVESRHRHVPNRTNTTVIYLRTGIMSSANFGPVYSEVLAWARLQATLTQHRFVVLHQSEGGLQHKRVGCCQYSYTQPLLRLTKIAHETESAEITCIKFSPSEDSLGFYMYLAPSGIRRKIAAP